jgi:uncharacterized NAD(P)/FAD-binding protein YdhS
MNRRDMARHRQRYRSWAIEFHRPGGTFGRREIRPVSDAKRHAALRLWSELPREVQEKLFETAVPFDPMIRNRLAMFCTTVIQGRRIRLNQHS